MEGGADPDDMKPDLLAGPRPHRGPERDLLVLLDDVVKLLASEGGLVHPEDELALDVGEVDIDHLAVNEGGDLAARWVDDEVPNRPLSSAPIMGLPIA
jgi:hypothetical protein